MALEQHLIQEQQQQQLLQQRLTAQQILQVRMLEMPLAQIEQAVNSELCDNPALEAESPYGDDAYDGGGDDAYAPSGSESSDEGYDGNDDGEDSMFDEGRDDNAVMEQERADREDAMDSALDNMGSDDRDGMPDSDYHTCSNNSDRDADQEERVFGESQSFYDILTQQAADEDLDDRQKQIMDYLIGSLDGNGRLVKDLPAISDELAIYQYMDCTTEEIAHVLKILQSFDPAGVGARSLQECLLLQIARREPSEMRRRMAIVIAKYFDDFTKKHWRKIAGHLRISEEQAERVIAELRRLNPKPGASLGETIGRNTQQVTPDFIVDTAFDGTVTFQLNHGDLPQLRVSEDFIEQLKGFQSNREALNKREREGFLYVREKVEKAKGYIEAIHRRNQTMEKTMAAIIHLQEKFFRDGDESDIQPMTLKDVADRIGMDISTVSRVCNSKYADTRWGTFKLRHFFSEGYAVEGQEEELSTRKIKLALKDLIEAEDKRKPLSDDALAKLMKKEGYPIARRTVAKYREQMNIPVARLRK